MPDSVFNASSKAGRVAPFSLGGGKGFLTYALFGFGNFTGISGTSFAISMFSLETGVGDLGSSFISWGE